MQAVASRSSSIFEQADEWFSRAKAALLGGIPCGSGCCGCCIGPFAITLLDIEELHRGLQTMPAVQRGELEARAQRQIAAIEARYPRLAIDPHLENCPDEEIDQLVTEFADLPCPALQDDRTCALYDYRPITCRTMGIPTETAGTVQGACETQTFIPVVKLSDSLRAEEDRLAEKEAGLLRAGKWLKSFRGDEVLLPYGFVMESNRAS